MRADHVNEGPKEGVSGPPRWVKVFAVIGLVIFAVFVLLLVGGHEGAGRHF